MADKVAVNKLLSDLGAPKMSNVWSDDVTHLVMDEIILTIKAMNALAKGVPIVEPRYFSDLLSAVETKQSLPGKCSWYQGCQMAQFDPFLSLNCIVPGWRAEGAQSKERKGSNCAILQSSVAEP